MSIAFTFVSGCSRLISLLISSTHQILVAVDLSVVLQPGIYMIMRTSKLHFKTAPALNHLLVVDQSMQRRAVAYASQRGQNLRHAVVRKHGNLVDVLELAPGLAVEARPQVRDKDLGPLEYADGLLAAVELVLVPEADKVAGQGVDQPRRRVLARGDQVRDATRVFLWNVRFMRWLAFPTATCTRVYGKGRARLTSYKTCPASLRHVSRASRRGISSSVHERKTCRRESSVHSSSSCQ